ncbi:MAG: 3-oxoacid CoA-transferase subunit A [Chloroflexota bacterium]
MLNKIIASPEEALSDVFDGATVLIGGFGEVGVPYQLIGALARTGRKCLTVVNNNAGNRDEGVAELLLAGAVQKVICSFPHYPDGYVFRELHKSGAVELELVPQGTMSERMRCAGAGLGGFLTPTGVGTEVARGKQVLEMNGREYLLEEPLHADFAIIRAHKADRWGNLTYRMAMRNFNPVMAMAATVTIAEVDEVVELGDLDPEVIVTSGVFVHRVVQRRPGDPRP